MHVGVNEHVTNMCLVVHVLCWIPHQLYILHFIALLRSVSAVCQQERAIDAQAQTGTHIKRLQNEYSRTLELD